MYDRSKLEAKMYNRSKLEARCIIDLNWKLQI